MADVVARAPGFASTDRLRENWDVVAEVAEGTALVDGSNRPGVAYTPSGGHTISKTVGGLTVSGFIDGGASLLPLQVTAATDGTWEFPVTGATAATKNGTKVYAVVAAGRITALNLTSSGNVFFGVVNNPAGYDAPGAFACVKIGVVSA